MPEVGPWRPAQCPRRTWRTTSRSSRSEVESGQLEHGRSIRRLVTSGLEYRLLEFELSLTALTSLQGCRQEAERPGISSNCITPLTLDIDDNLSELHLDPVTISPYSLPGDTAPPDTSPKSREVLGERRDRKESVRTVERERPHPGKSHHGIKGKQQRDRRKLREKRRSTGVVHLASTESTGGTTSGEEELSECDVGSETKRNTQQNETIGDSSLVVSEMDPGNQQQVTESGGGTGAGVAVGAGGGGGGGGGGGLVVGERKNSGRSVHTGGNSHNRARMRNKNVARSEDMEADDELVSLKVEITDLSLEMFQGDKTDNDHERISPNSVMPILSHQPEPSQRHGDSDLVRQLQEKERRIQYLELKIQQLTQVN